MDTVVRGFNHFESNFVLGSEHYYYGVQTHLSSELETMKYIYNQEGFSSVPIRKSHGVKVMVDVHGQAFLASSQERRVVYPDLEA